MKKGGSLIFSVPYTLENEKIQEHFDGLHDFKILNDGDEYYLENIDKNGLKRVYRDLIFHGGSGTTLEMRVFALSELIQNLKDAGVSKIEILSEPLIEMGIYWKDPWSIPILAKK